MGNSCLTPEAKAARNAYRRDWNRKHPEKNKEYIATYWKKKSMTGYQDTNNKSEKEVYYGDCENEDGRCSSGADQRN